MLLSRLSHRAATAAGERLGSDRYGAARVVGAGGGVQGGDFLGAVHAVAERGARRPCDGLRRAVAVVGGGPRGLLGVDLGLLRGLCVGSRTRRAGSREMPGAEWFPGARLSLCRARLPRQATPPRWRSATRPSCAALAELTWGELREADGADRGRAARAWRRARATAWSRTCRTSRRRWRRSSRARRSGRCGRGARRTSARGRSSTASRRSSRRCCWRSTATATTAATSTGATWSAALRGGDAVAGGDGAAAYLERGRCEGLAKGDRLEELFERAARMRARVRAGALRPSAVGPLLVRHDRAAEGDRARPGRHPARAPQEAEPAPRRAARATASSGSRRPAG